MSEKAECLKVYMMGSVSAEYAGRILPVGGALSGRVLQLLLILLYYHDKGIGREELLDMMYGDGEYANPSGSLRGLVYRLRKLLGEYLPPGEYIRKEEGIYCWNHEAVNVYVDARDFEDRAVRALDSRDEEALRSACALYKGEFLSQMAGENWITVVSVRCQELYFQCLRSLNEKMRKKKEYPELLKIINVACEMYPYEECQIMKIDCLISMKRFREAMKVYKGAVGQYFEEHGLPPSERMLERFRVMSNQIRYTAGMVHDVKESLKEMEAVQGPYYCSYPSFIDGFRFVNRLRERINFHRVLIGVFLLDARGKALDHESQLQKDASRQLRLAIGGSLRKGDIFTCYSPGQFLVLINGAEEEDCGEIFRRIENRFKSWEAWRRVRLKYEVLE